MKKLNFWHLCLVVWLGIASFSCAQNKATFDIKEEEKLIEFTTNRFTLPNLHVTPDGENIIFDVLGDIYQVPIEGGKAEVLLQDNNWKRAGKLSPDQETLTYVSDETGEFQVWTMNLITKKKRVYPIIELSNFPMYAYWQDDKHLLIPSKEGLQRFNITTGKRQVIRLALEREKSILHSINRNMNVSRLGAFAYFQSDGALWEFDIENQIDLYIEEIPDNEYLRFIRGSANGKKVLFYKKNKEDNSEQDLVSWNLATNNLNNLNTTKTLGNSTSLNYSFDFIDDNSIILDKEGEIVRMNIETGEYELIPIEVEVKKVIKKPLSREPQYIKDSTITASVLRNPVTQKDLDTIYFGAFGKLHSYSKNTEVITEVYPEKDRFEVSPNLSPDGKYLAFTTWNDTEMGHVYAREIKTGKEYQLTKTAGRYINPTWSPDGKEMVFLADETETKMGIGSQKSSGAPKYLVYDIDLHRIKVVENKSILKYQYSDVIGRIFPSTNLSKRFYPVPAYHPNGKSIYIATRNREKDLAVFQELNLMTKTIDEEYPIPYHIDEVLLSPNSSHIAYIYDNQIWIDNFPNSSDLVFSSRTPYIEKRFHVGGGYVLDVTFSTAKSIYEVTPNYLSWQDENILMWGSAEEVYTYDVRTGKTEKIADIKVQKPRDIPKIQYALTNARIITMNKQDEIIEKGTILIKDNRIRTIGQMEKIVIPESYKVFDLEGKTIIPGLIDVHAHYHYFFYEFQLQQNYNYIGNLAYGITTIYDPSVNVLDYREQAQMVETGQNIGPRIFASGNIIFGSPGRERYDYNKINNYQDAARIIKSNKKINAFGPIKQYDLDNRQYRKWLYKAAKRYNMTLTNHETNFISSMTQIIDGYTAMEHEKYSFPIQKDVIELIGQSGIHYTPTFMVSPGIGHLFVNESYNQKRKLKKLNHKLVYQNNYAKYEFDVKSISELHKRDLERREIQNRVDAGGKIRVGGHGNPLPGIGTHWELWAFTYDNGLTNYEALQTATINGAEKIDLQKELGSIEESKLADLVVLNSNPLVDIFNTTDIQYTIQNGSIYESETMKQIYPIEKMLRSWGWNSNKVLDNMEYISVEN